MTDKQTPDWEAIHSQYRAGLLSVRAIAEQHNISDTAIRSKAKKHGWQRDLTEQVRQAAKAKVVRATVRTSSSHEPLRTDEQIIEAESTDAAAMLLAHRVYLSRWSSIAEKLAESLAETAVTEDNQADFARSLNAGVDAQLKVIKGQRQAYNIDSIPDDDSKAPAGLGHFYADRGESDT